jgi:enoyl-CoA hydratase
MTDDVVFSRLPGCDGDLGMILLDRPKVLNALTEAMCIQIHQQLDQWKIDDTIKAVVIQGAGDKAFCAGGDIRWIYDNGPEKAKASSSFFLNEYRMNHAIFHCNKPYIALLDGITMGGGCGVSMHGSHRVATEHLMLAMPETGIGFFPDIGAGYFLSRLKDASGLYLGLTGNRIGWADALYTGLATHALARDNISAFIGVLASTAFGDSAHDAVDQVLSEFRAEVGSSELLQYRELMLRIFSLPSVDAVVQALSTCHDSADQVWCEKALVPISRKSPTSVHVAFSQIQRAKTMSFDEVMQMEFRLAMSMIEQGDFYEGVRAAIVDKDRNPQWSPKDLLSVNQEDVEALFQPRQVELIFE